MWRIRLAIARVLRSLANRHASGRLVFVLEGGYAPSAMADAIAAMLHELR